MMWWLWPKQSQMLTQENHGHRLPCRNSLVGLDHISINSSLNILMTADMTNQVSDKTPWGGGEKIMVTYRVQTIHWPEGVTHPGGPCNYSNLDWSSTGEGKKLFDGLFGWGQEHVAIEPWSEGKPLFSWTLLRDIYSSPAAKIALACKNCDADDDPQYLAIPLVTSTKGKSLLSIGDFDHQKHTAHQQRDAAATVLDSEMGDSSDADNSDMDGPTVSKNVKLGKSRVLIYLMKQWIEHLGKFKNLVE